MLKMLPLRLKIRKLKSKKEENLVPIIMMMNLMSPKLLHLQMEVSKSHYLVLK